MVVNTIAEFRLYHAAGGKTACSFETPPSMGTRNWTLLRAIGDVMASPLYLKSILRSVLVGSHLQLTARFRGTDWCPSAETCTDRKHADTS